MAPRHGWLALATLALMVSTASGQPRPFGYNPNGPPRTWGPGPNSCGGSVVWAATNVGAGTTSQASSGPDFIGIDGPFTPLRCHALMGEPVRGMTIFPAPHVVVTTRPSLWWIAGGATREQLLLGTAGAPPIFAAAYDCNGVIQEVYAVTDTTFHVLVGGQVFANALPGKPIAAGIVSQNAPFLQTCEAVVLCDDNPVVPGVRLWTQLGGVNRTTNIVSDPVANTEMYMVPFTPGGVIIACAAAVVFESTVVTVVQGGSATVYPLSSLYAGHAPAVGGINVALSGGGTAFIPLICPTGAIPQRRALGVNGQMSFLNSPGSRGRNMASPPPFF